MKYKRCALFDISVTLTVTKILSMKKLSLQDRAELLALRNACAFFILFAVCVVLGSQSDIERRPIHYAKVAGCLLAFAPVVFFLGRGSQYYQGICQKKSA